MLLLSHINIFIWHGCLTSFLIVFLSLCRVCNIVIVTIRIVIIVVNDCVIFFEMTHARTHTLTHSFARSLTHSLTPPSFPPLFLPCASSSPLWAPTDLDHSKSQLKRRKLATSSIAHPQHARARTPWQAPAQQHARARTLSRAPAHERISQKMPDRMS